MDKIVFYNFAFSAYQRILAKQKKNINLPVNIERNIIHGISHLSLKPLILLMKVHIENGVIFGATPSDRYEKFDQYSACDDFFSVIEDCYPQLVKKISYLVKSKIENYLNLSERFEKDKKEIKEKLGFDADKLSDCKLYVGLSDIHDGKENYLLEYQEKKLVYKARDSYSDNFWKSIIEWINEKADNNLLYGVMTLNKETYSWHEYINYSELYLEDNVQEYYYKIGGLAFLAYLFDMTDLHMENIICSSKGPVVVDAETICHLVIDKDKHEVEVSTYFDELLISSILKTELFPASNWRTKRKNDISGICGKGDQVVEDGKLELENPFSDRMNLKKADGILKGKENIPKINGEYVNPKKYANFIKKGFKDIYEIILRNKGELIKHIATDENLKKTNIRVVFHDTQLYQDLIEFSTFPSNLMIEGLDKIYEIIKDLCKDKKEVLIRDIFKNLILGNVPIYFGNVESKLVKTSEGEVCYEYEEKPISQIFNRIENLNVSDLDFQINLIKLSLLNFREKYKNREFLMQDISKKNQAIEVSNIKKEVKVIIQKIRNKAFLSKDGYINWITIENNYPNWNIKFQDCSLYSGLSGNAIFFAGAYKTFGDIEYLEILLKILETIEKKLELDEKTSPAFTGTFSVVYLYFFLYKQGFGDIYYKKGLDLITQHEVQIINNKNYDLLDGISGVLIVLIQTYKLHENDYVLNLINKLGENLLNKIFIENNKITWGEEEMLTGLAHGVAGVSYALVKLYELTGLNKYRELASSLVDYENLYFNQKEETWAETYQKRIQLFSGVMGL